jgi:hypothetical protein
VTNYEKKVNPANHYHCPKMTEHKLEHDICRWKSRSWLGTGTPYVDGNPDPGSGQAHKNVTGLNQLT